MYNNATKLRIRYLKWRGTWKFLFILLCSRKLCFIFHSAFLCSSPAHLFPVSCLNGLGKLPFSLCRLWQIRVNGERIDYVQNHAYSNSHIHLQASFWELHLNSILIGFRNAHLFCVFRVVYTSPRLFFFY